MPLPICRVADSAAQRVAALEKVLKDLPDNERYNPRDMADLFLSLASDLIINVGAVASNTLWESQWHKLYKELGHYEAWHLGDTVRTTQDYDASSSRHLNGPKRVTDVVVAALRAAYDAKCSTLTGAVTDDTAQGHAKHFEEPVLRTALRTGFVHLAVTLLQPVGALVEPITPSALTQGALPRHYFAVLCVKPSRVLSLLADMWGSEPGKGANKSSDGFFLKRLFHTSISPAAVQDDSGPAKWLDIRSHTDMAVKIAMCALDAMPKERGSTHDSAASSTAPREPPWALAEDDFTYVHGKLQGRAQACAVVAEAMVRRIQLDARRATKVALAALSKEADEHDADGGRMEGARPAPASKQAPKQAPGQPIVPKGADPDPDIHEQRAEAVKEATQHLRELAVQAAKLACHANSHKVRSLLHMCAGHVAG